MIELTEKVFTGLVKSAIQDDAFEDIILHIVKEARYGYKEFKDLYSDIELFCDKHFVGREYVIVMLIILTNNGISLKNAYDFIIKSLQG